LFRLEGHDGFAGHPTVAFRDRPADVVGYKRLDGQWLRNAVPQKLPRDVKRRFGDFIGGQLTVSSERVDVVLTPP
jgi:hypothetical protein